MSFNIKQNFNGHVDDQNVWTVASNKEEAYRNFRPRLTHLGLPEVKMVAPA